MLAEDKALGKRDQQMAITLCWEEVLKHREPCSGIMMSLGLTFCLWTQGTSWRKLIDQIGSRLIEQYGSLQDGRMLLYF